MKFPNIKDLLKKALNIIPLILAIWGFLDKKKDNEEDEE